MPLDFAGFFLQNSIENTIIASRIHLMDLVAKYPHITYPRLDKNLKADPAILKRVFLNNNDNFILVKYVPEELKKKSIIFTSINQAKCFGIRYCR